MKTGDSQPLDQYRSKRDFAKTIEPGDVPIRPAFPNLRFVIQKHAATRLHYDFRLELDGVLLSWAVPGGPSLNPNDKRLAMHVEAHPLEYATFEGVIGHGNYGSGQVIVWDYGIYSPDENGRLSFGDPEVAQQRLREELENGKLSFTLSGQKLKGSWTLVRTARNPKEWLLIKHKDIYVSERDVLAEDTSVQSGLRLEDLKNGRLPTSPITLVTRESGQLGNSPTTIRPMLASTAEVAFDAPGWLFEPKLDGYRVFAFRSAGRVRLVSRNGKDMTNSLPIIVHGLESQPESEAVLDGELVALGEDGLPSFGLLQRYLSEYGLSSANSAQFRLIYYPFDILYAYGRDVTRLPLSQRKQLLQLVMVASDVVVPVQYAVSRGKDFFRGVSELGLEGMIAKRQDSTYLPNSRSRDWLKIKTTGLQEFVIGGYTQGQGVRTSFFGALLLGYYENGTLRFAGRVGTGFDDGLLRDLTKDMKNKVMNTCPFADDPMLRESRNTWVHPTSVAQVKFAEWTIDGHLRAPVFLGIREDVDARSVISEKNSIPQANMKEGYVGDPSMAVVAEVLEQLDTKRDRVLLQVGEHRISLTNLDKPLWPASDQLEAVTKKDMIHYYTQIAPVLLPHIRDRPMTLTRYPNGAGGKSFYQKHYDQNLPEFVETVELFSSSNEGDQRYIQVNNLATLVWLSQLSNIELHPWNSRTVADTDASGLITTFRGSKEHIEASALNFPDFIVFDLDPYIYSGDEESGDEPALNKRAFAKVVEVALALKDILDQLSLSSFVKTSGKTGLHIYVPIVRRYDYTTVREVCQLIGTHLLQQLPNDITMEWSTSKRSDKIFFDHNQNVRGKNMASIYSLRPQAGAPVSAPVRWDELSRIYPPEFNINTMPDRVAELGDLWKDIFATKHDLGKVLGV